MSESAEYAGNFKDEFELPFRILTDIDNGYALSCGLMISLGNAVQQEYLNLGRDLADFQRNKAWFVPIPATYIIGLDGRVRLGWDTLLFSAALVKFSVSATARKFRI